MRLLDLEPRWVTKADRRITVGFACPVHACKGLDRDGNAACMVARVVVPFDVAYLDVGSGPLWSVAGTDFANLTTTPSVRVAQHLVEEGAGCHWHGFVTAGDVSVPPDSMSPAVGLTGNWSP